MSLDLEEQYEKVYAFCFFKVLNREVAEDLTQETFLNILKQHNILKKAKNLPFFIPLQGIVIWTIFEKQKNNLYRKSG